MSDPSRRGPGVDRRTVLAAAAALAVPAAGARERTEVRTMQA